MALAFKGKVETNVQKSTCVNLTSIFKSFGSTALKTFKCKGFYVLVKRRYLMLVFIVNIVFIKPSTTFS